MTLVGKGPREGHALNCRGDLMERKKISARSAVADIRSGMDDIALMKKYGLSANGVQSLFDKLINDGFLDLGELGPRLSGFMGTVVVPEADFLGEKGRVNDQPLKSKSARTINVQEAARDIRSGMYDSALAAKYRLTPKGLTSLFDKLWSLGVLTQMDLDRRQPGMEEDTVDLREMKLELADALNHLGFNSPASSAVEIETESHDSTVNPIVKGTNKKEIAAPGPKADRTFQGESRDVGPLESSWYDKLIILILLLLGVFPLGFYGLYRTRRIATATKAFIILGWFAVAVVWVLVFYGKIWEFVP
jgi:hypothetical protein